MTLPDGRVVDGLEFSVDESHERWSEVKLEDGASFRVKMTVLSAQRANELDPAGQPIYQFNMAPVIGLVDFPPNLKKKKGN